MNSEFIQANTTIRFFRLIFVAFFIAGINGCFDFDWTSDSGGTPGTQNTIKDIDGNDYAVVKVGTQFWLFNDLRTTRYANGDSIGTTHPITLDISAMSTPRFQWSYAGLYGKYYTWNAATDSRGICPNGWHVPTVNDWQVLINYLGGSSVAGEKLKIGGGWSDFGSSQSEWVLPFQPVGKRESHGEFVEYMTNGYWWSSESVATNDQGVYYSLKQGSKEVFKGNYEKKAGLCIRCIKD